MTGLSGIEIFKREPLIESGTFKDIRENCALPRGVTEIAVDISTRDGAVIASVSGEVDALTTPTFSRALAVLLRKPQQPAVLDLAAAQFFGATALRELIEFSHTLAARGVGWALVGSQAVLRPLDVLGVDMPVCGSVQSAVERAAGRAV